MHLHYQVINGHSDYRISHKIFNETSQKPDGTKGILGTWNYALDFTYEDNLTSSWFWSGRLAYTPLQRTSEGNTSEIKLLHLKLLIGQNFSGSGRGGASWDWFAGDKWSARAGSVLVYFTTGGLANDSS
jgi:hypothetical protein